MGYGTYLGAKFLAYSCLTTVAFWLGLLSGAYYTVILNFGEVNWAHVLLGGLLCLPVFLVSVALTIFTSTLFSSQAAAGGTTLLGIIALTVLPKLGQWSAKSFPSGLLPMAGDLFAGKSVDPLVPLVLSGLIIVALLIGAWAVLRAQEL